MITVNGFQPLTIIKKCSILDVAVALDPPLLKGCFFQRKSDFESKTRKIKQVNIFESSLLNFISYIFVFLVLWKKL